MEEADKVKLEEIAAAHDTHQDFDGILAHYTGLLIAPEVQGKRTLECGCSTGVMTPMLLKYVSSLDVVEGSALYAKITEDKYPGQLRMFVSLFEEFQPEKPYEAIVFAGVLHHIADPVAILRKVSEWLIPGGKIYISVPNMTSFHRRLGVAMELTDSVYETSARNTFFAQPGRFDAARLEETVLAAGLKVNRSEAFFFKPFPHDVMNKMTLETKVLDGLFKMGQAHPDLACQLFLIAEK